VRSGPGQFEGVWFYQTASTRKSITTNDDDDDGDGDVDARPGVAKKSTAGKRDKGLCEWAGPARPGEAARKGNKVTGCCPGIPV